MSDSNWMEWSPEGSWGVKVEYDADAITNLDGLHLSDTDAYAIAAAIERDGREAYVEVPSMGMAMCQYEWSTGIDFGHDAEGGGYVISFSDEDHCDRYGINVPTLCVLVEWNDDYAQEAGHDERADEMTCVRIGLDALQEFLG